MSKILKRWIGAALVLVLMLCTLPVAAIAAEEEPLEITSVKIVFSNGETHGTARAGSGMTAVYQGGLEAASFGDYEFYFMINDDPNLTFGGTTAADGTLSPAVAGETVNFTVPAYEAPYDCVDIDIHFHTPSMTFSVEYEKKIDISKGTAEYIGDRTYNGEKQLPNEADIRLIVNGEQLYYVSISDCEYWVSGGSLPLAGNAACRVVGMGEYSGSISVPFTIKKRPLTITLADQTINFGESIKNDAYTVEGLLEGDSITVDQLLASTSDVTDSGQITLPPAFYHIRNESASQYDQWRGSCYDITVIPGKLTILPLSIEAAEVSLDGSEFTYDGSEKKPVAVVTLEGTQLVEGTDYQVTYSDNVDAGTATVTVEGIGHYSGTVRKTFTILPKEITAEISVKDRDYDGTKDAQIESAALVGAVTGDDVTLTQGAASFSDVEGENLAVTFTGFSLSGTDAGNYTLVMPTDVTGTINPKPVETTEETTTPTTEETTTATTQPVVTIPPTDGSPATGDYALALPVLGVLISALGLIVLIYQRKKQMLV